MKNIYDYISKDMKYAIMKIVWPMITNLGYWLKSSDKEREVNQEDWFYLSRSLRHGDVILSTKRANPGNLFLPGKAKHASMVIDPDPNCPLLIESVSKGVQKIPLFDFIKDKSYLVHCRSKVFGEGISKKAAKIASSMEGTPYDYFWSPSNNWLYCSELIYESYKKAYITIVSLYGIKPDSFPLTMEERCGEMTYIPDDVRLDLINWDILWSNT